MRENRIRREEKTNFWLLKYNGQYTDRLSGGAGPISARMCYWECGVKHQLRCCCSTLRQGRRGAVRVRHFQLTDGSSTWKSAEKTNPVRGFNSSCSVRDAVVIGSNPIHRFVIIGDTCSKNRLQLTWSRNLVQRKVSWAREMWPTQQLISVAKANVGNL